MNVYIVRNGKSLGPYTEAQAKERLTAGEFSPDDLVRLEGEESSQPLSQWLAPDTAASSGKTAASLPLGQASPRPRSAVSTVLLGLGGLIVVGAALVGAWMLFFRAPRPAPVEAVAAASPAPAAAEASAPAMPAPEPEDTPGVPSEEDLAIGPDIARGAQTISSLPAAPNLGACEKEISDAFSADKEKGTNSDGFLLGANYGAWKVLSGMLAGPDVQNLNDAAAMKNAKARAVTFFQEFRSRQDQLGVSDADFFKAIGFRSPEENAKAQRSLDPDEKLFSQFAHQ